MAQPLAPLSSHILNHLTARESRLLTLVVAVRRNLGRDEHVKGDLTEAIKSCLQKLIAARTVTEADGMFTLARAARHPGPLRVLAATSTAKTSAIGEDW